VTSPIQPEGSEEGMEFDLDSFVTLDGLTELNSCVVPVLVDDGGEKIRVAGSAFNIHPHGLWVTARHVIEDAIKNHRDAHIYLLWTDPEVSTEAAPPWLDSDDVPHSPLRLGALVSVNRFTKDDSGGSDLALLRAGMLRDGEPYMFPVCRLSAAFPAPARACSPWATPDPMSRQIPRQPESAESLSHAVFRSPQVKCSRCIERAGTPSGTLMADLGEPCRRFAFRRQRVSTVA
jgi:hypothetical protein